MRQEAHVWIEDLGSSRGTLLNGQLLKEKTELRPRFEEPRQKARTRIRALLTPEQQQKFDAMVAQHDAQRDEEQKNRR